MDELKINPKFQQLLPPLSANEYEILEASILESGVNEKIQIWKNFIIDGHNRYEIATAHHIPFMTRDRTFEFETEEGVLQWIFENQLGRRNLHDNVRTEVIGRYYEMIKKPVGNPQLVRTDLIGEPPVNIEESEEPEVEHYIDEIADEITYETDEYSQAPQPREPQPSRKKAAHTYGVSESKIKRASTYVQALDKVPEEVQEQARAGKISQAEVIRTASGEEKPVKKVFDKKEMKRLISKIAFEIESIATKCPDSREECDKALDFCRKAQEYTGV